MTTYLHRWAAFCTRCDMNTELRGLSYMLAQHVDDGQTKVFLPCPGCADRIIYRFQPFGARVVRETPADGQGDGDE